MQVKVQTRERPQGGFWCNATVRGHDHFEEGATAEEARDLFKKERKLSEEEIEWLPVQLYPQKEAQSRYNPYMIGPQKVRIDENPIG